MKMQFLAMTQVSFKYNQFCCQQALLNIKACGDIFP